MKRKEKKKPRKSFSEREYFVKETIFWAQNHQPTKALLYKDFPRKSLVPLTKTKQKYTRKKETTNPKAYSVFKINFVECLFGNHFGEQKYLLLLYIIHILAKIILKNSKTSF